MNVINVNGYIIFSSKNCFIPCLILSIIGIIFFIKDRQIGVFFATCGMLTASFLDSPWGKNISSKAQTVLIIILFIFAFLTGGFGSRFKDN